MGENNSSHSIPKAKENAHKPLRRSNLDIKGVKPKMQGDDFASEPKWDHAGGHVALHTQN